MLRRLGDTVFELSLRVLWPGPAWPQRYALAIVLTIAVGALKLAVPPFGERGPDLFLTIPVAVSAVVAGFGPALLAVLGATAVAAYFTPPAFELRLISRLDALDLFAFFVEGLVIAVLGAGLRGALLRALSSLRRQQELERERTALFATVQHELRNPLAALSGQLELASRYAARDEPRERVSDALASARVQVSRLLRLTEDLLLIATTPDTSFRIDAERVDLRAAVEAAAQRARVAAATHAVRCVLPDDAIEVAADPARLDQILDNLIRNAMRFSPAGTTVEITTARSQMRPVGVARVRDEGPGVQPGERDRIFERFMRGAASHGVSGSGIGLYVSRELATRMGGRLVLEDTSTIGTVFALELPLAAADERNRHEATVVA